MDYLIIVTVFGMSVLFFLAQLILFRLINQSSAIKWLFQIYLSCVFTLAVSIFILMTFQNKLIPHLKYEQAVLFFLVSVILFTLTCAIYILGIFGVMTSSIRMEILNIVGRSGTKGISIKELRNRYSVKNIITHRLNRFHASGELKIVHNKYQVQKKYSYFLLHMAFSTWLKKWYTPTI